MFGSPALAGLQAGASASTAALLDETRTILVSGNATFTRVDVTPFAGIIVTLSTLNPTGVAGSAFWSPSFTDARGNIIGFGGVPQGIQYLRPTGGGGPFSGFNAVYYRCLSRFFSSSVLQDSAGGGDVRVQVFGTSMVGRFDGPYCVSIPGQTLAAIVGVAGTTTVSPFYCGPANLYQADANSVGQVHAILTQQLTGQEIAGVGPGVTGIAARTVAPIWVPAIPTSLVFAGGGSGTVSLLSA